MSDSNNARLLRLSGICCWCTSQESNIKFCIFSGYRTRGRLTCRLRYLEHKQRALYVPTYVYVLVITIALADRHPAVGGVKIEEMVIPQGRYNSDSI